MKPFSEQTNVISSDSKSDVDIDSKIYNSDSAEHKVTANETGDKFSTDENFMQIDSSQQSCLKFNDEQSASSLVTDTQNDTTEKKENVEFPSTVTAENQKVVEKKQPKYCAKPTARLSQFELTRLQNLEENQKFLEDINLTSHSSVLAPKPPKRMYVKKEWYPNEPKRESKRLKIETTPRKSRHHNIPQLSPGKIWVSEPASGDFSLCCSNNSLNRFGTVVKNLTSKKNLSSGELSAPSIVQNLSNLTFESIYTGLATKEKIFDIDFHPGASKILLALGNQEGKLKFFDINKKSEVWVDCINCLRKNN